MKEPGAIHRILELARWAPSGDNAQPWRFELAGTHRLVVHAFDTRDRCIYDLDGRPSQLAQGALLETIRIAASGEGLAERVVRMNEIGPGQARIELAFEPSVEPEPDPLLPFITTRCTERRAMSTTPLGAERKRRLEASSGRDYALVWFEGAAARTRCAWLLAQNGKLRLTLPEAYATHRDVIEWGASHSIDRIPERAVGVDAATAKLMRWALQSWGRVDFLNRYLGGTLMPRLQLDLVPGLACGAHFAIFSSTPLVTLEHYLDAGRAMQRVWLTAEAAGLKVQPEMTPGIFARYVREGRRFTSSSRLWAQACRTSGKLAELMHPHTLDRLVFMGRIGRPKSPCVSRSLRLPLAQLMVARASC